MPVDVRRAGIAVMLRKSSWVVALSAVGLVGCGKTSVPGQAGDPSLGPAYPMVCAASVEDETKNCSTANDCCSGHCFAGEHCKATRAGQPCSDFRYCASGYCRHDGTCAETITSCKLPGEACSSLYNDCCGEGDCEAGKCKLVECRPDGDRCRSSSECCKGLCQDGTCGNCIPDGATCTTDELDCCSASCSAADACGSSCRAWGRGCDKDSDCCTGFYCGVPPGKSQKQCVTNLRCSGDGFECTINSQCCSYNCNGGLCRDRCVEFGLACKAPKDCCAGPCVDGKCGLCKPEGDLCTVHQDCCSGTCNGTQCTRCRGRNQQCANDSDCCNGLSCSHQFCDSCLSNWSSCQADSDCCSGRCYANTCVVAL